MVNSGLRSDFFIDFDKGVYMKNYERILLSREILYLSSTTRGITTTKFSTRD